MSTSKQTSGFAGNGDASAPGSCIKQGWWQKDIAAALGVSRAAVCQWIKRAREGGVEALRTRPRPGRAGEADGASSGRRSRRCWPVEPRRTGSVATSGRRSRVAAVIERTFGVRYHRDHVSRLLRQAGWSQQPPILSAGDAEFAPYGRPSRRWSTERCAGHANQAIGGTATPLGCGTAIGLALD